MPDESIKAKEKFTLEEITAINAQVAVPPDAPGNTAFAPVRTLWYAQYDLENLTLTMKFYLGEKPDPENEKRVILEYFPFSFCIGNRPIPVNAYALSVRIGEFLGCKLL